MLFYLAFVQRSDRRLAFGRESVGHAAGLKEITRLEFVSPPSREISSELREVCRGNLAKRWDGETYLVELGFDGERHGKKMDFRPALPLMFCW